MLSMNFIVSLACEHEPPLLGETQPQKSWSFKASTYLFVLLVVQVAMPPTPSPRLVGQHSAPRVSEREIGRRAYSHRERKSFADSICSPHGATSNQQKYVNNERGSGRFSRGVQEPGTSRSMGGRQAMRGSVGMSHAGSTTNGGGYGMGGYSMGGGYGMGGYGMGMGMGMFPLMSGMLGNGIVSQLYSLQYTVQSLSYMWQMAYMNSHSVVQAYHRALESYKDMLMKIRTSEFRRIVQRKSRRSRLFQFLFVVASSALFAAAIKLIQYYLSVGPRNGLLANFSAFGGGYGSGYGYSGGLTTAPQQQPTMSASTAPAVASATLSTAAPMSMPEPAVS